METKTNKSKGAIMSLVSLIFVLASTIIYAVNVNQTGYFKGASVTNMVLFEIITMIILAVSFLYSMCPINGVADKICDFVLSVLRVLGCVLIALCLINLVAARVEGLGFIYFSNADVTLEVQTPENLASSQGTICNLVMLTVTLIVNIVSSFFNLKRK